MTVQPKPFIKLHWVFIEAAAAVLFIDGCSARRTVTKKMEEEEMIGESTNE